MIIETLSLKNFRRFKTLNLTFKNGFNIIAGKNGSGKTSILESIYILSTGKSFLTNTLSNCVSFDEEYFLIEGNFKDGGDNEVSFLLYKDKKEIRLNKRRVKTLAEIVGKFPVVATDYSLVELVKGGPSKRRDFINHLLIFTCEGYYKALLRYYAFLEKKNVFLRNGNFTMDMLLFLSQELYNTGLKIKEERESIIKEINRYLKDYFNKMGGNNTVIEMEYEPSKLDMLLSEDAIIEETKKKHTLFGIHLDEIRLSNNGIDLREFASLGEAYNIGFVLKLIESILIKDYTGNIPLLLIDDFFSHLDATRIEEVLNRIKENQVIITTINLTDVPAHILKEGVVFSLDEREY